MGGERRVAGFETGLHVIVMHVVNWTEADLRSSRPPER